ncbi:hypothetical protein FA09DRAFT_331729 [Tilletiopsis washingtonensis]|uniref:Uncharacterized protein n=1 Tax=Tilletiopsis washingtonensis TaxID=58919 RepID=A0A316Z1U8_9BASI|nr:hypothetical protein FA09DRAFT_331729 [Tilletiopsis washingtonensis]PWN95757.1 hypothetical protein FA09DRAFT_331729 [Tilletiopsis washingtonensis]
MPNTTLRRRAVTAAAAAAAAAARSTAQAQQRCDQRFHRGACTHQHAARVQRSALLKGAGGRGGVAGRLSLRAICRAASTWLCRFAAALRTSTHRSASSAPSQISPV